LTRTWERK